MNRIRGRRWAGRWEKWGSPTEIIHDGSGQLRAVADLYAGGNNAALRTTKAKSAAACTDSLDCWRPHFGMAGCAVLLERVAGRAQRETIIAQEVAAIRLTCSTFVRLKPIAEVLQKGSHVQGVMCCLPVVSDRYQRRRPIGAELAAHGLGHKPDAAAFERS